MNFYAIIILTTLLLSFAINLIGNLLNLKALKDDLPGEFEDTYDSDAYRNSQKYTRDRTRFGLIQSTFGFIIILSFWFSGGFNYVDQMVLGWNLGSIWNGLAYMGILVLAKMILALPFSVYSTFVIEERHGFNKTTGMTFMVDLMKMLVLMVLLGGPLLAGLLLLFDNVGSLAWVYCWVFVVLFTLILQTILPTWILPLFNKFKQLDEGELRTSLLSYAKSVTFPIENVFVIDGSRRSSKSNAFFTGFGKNKRLALFDTLVENHDIKELVAIFAHEVGHHKKKHILKGMLISFAHTGLVFFLLSIFISHKGLFDAFYMENQPTYAGFIFFGMLYSPMELILSIFMQLFSRKNEYEADHFAASTIEDAEDMVKALKKLSRDNLTNLTPHSFFVFMNYSHPPILDRIRAIRQVTVGA